MVDWDCVGGIASDDGDWDWDVAGSASQLVGISSAGLYGDNWYVDNSHKNKPHKYDVPKNTDNELRCYKFYGMSVYSNKAYGVYMETEATQLQWFPKSKCYINEKEHYIEIPNWLRYLKGDGMKWSAFKKDK